MRGLPRFAACGCETRPLHSATSLRYRARRRALMSALAIAHRQGHQALPAGRQQGGRARPLRAVAHHRAGRVRRHPGAERLRQEHPVAARRLAGAADRRHGRASMARRPASSRPSTRWASPSRIMRCCPGSAFTTTSRCRSGWPAGESMSRRSPACSSWSGSAASAPRGPSSSRAACASAPRSPGRWCSSPRCCCSTSRSARSMR